MSEFPGLDLFSYLLTQTTNVRCSAIKERLEQLTACISGTISASKVFTTKGGGWGHGSSCLGNDYISARIKTGCGDGDDGIT